MAPKEAKQRVTRRWYLTLAFLLACLVGMGVSGVGRTQVAYAATFNTSAYNSASLKGTWPTTSSTNSAKVYIDSAGTLHISGTAYPLQADGYSGLNLSDVQNVKMVSFEGSTSFNDATNGIFQNFTNVTKITDLDNVDVSQMTSMNYLFSKTQKSTSAKSTNAKLVTIEGLSSWNTGRVTETSYMFNNQPNLTTIDGIENWNVSNVTSMTSMFRDDTSMTSFPNLSGWVTRSVQEFNYMFSGLTSLTALESIRNWNTGSATTFEGMFDGDSKLTFNGRLNWDTSASQVFSYMFRDNTSMTSLDLSKWDVTSGTQFDSMFEGMTKLTSIDLTDWQPTNGEEFANMFLNDGKITSLPGISGWTMANASNLNGMFQGMTSVTNLPVAKWQLMSSGGSNVTQIFWGDNALTDIDVSGWTIKGSWTAGDKIFPTYSYTSSTLQSSLKTITFGKNWAGKVTLPQFLLAAGTYGTWRGVNHDKDNVTGPGTSSERYVPPSTAANRVETFRFAYDIKASLVDNDGKAVALADVPIIVTDADGSEVTRANTGSDGTVTVPTNVTNGEYTVTLGDLPDGYAAVVGKVTTTISDADGSVQLVVGEQNDDDLIAQYPHAGGRGTLLTVIAGALAVLIGATGMLMRRFA